MRTALGRLLQIAFIIAVTSTLHSLRTLTAEDGARTARHKKVGPITLSQMLHEWSLHDLGHVRQAQQ